MRWFVCTPDFDHWHHADDPVAYNSNFAGEFPWIDALFGTLQRPHNRVPATYGITDTAPDGYLRQIARPMQSSGQLTQPLTTPIPTSLEVASANETPPWPSLGTRGSKTRNVPAATHGLTHQRVDGVVDPAEDLGDPVEPVLQDPLHSTLERRGTHGARATGALQLDLDNTGRHIGAQEGQIAPVGLDGWTHELDDRIEGSKAGTALLVGEPGHCAAGGRRFGALRGRGDVKVHLVLLSVGPQDRHIGSGLRPTTILPCESCTQYVAARAGSGTVWGQPSEQRRAELGDGRDQEDARVPWHVPLVRPSEFAGAIGLILPTLVQDTAPAWVEPGDGRGTNGDPLSDLADLCHQAEVAGASALWACDHLFWHGPCLECMVVLTVAAMATERAVVGSCVIQLPLRRAVALAKQAATLQTLSQGRMILGVGVGSHAGEYEQVNADYHSRGHDLDTAIDELHRAWRSAHGTTRGDTFSSDPTDRYLQLPTPAPIPVWVGGSSEAALRRAARLADGWMPLFLSVDEYGDAVERLGKEVDASGRAPGTVTPAIVLFVSIDGDPDHGMAKGTQWMGSLYGIPPKAFERHLIAGSADEVAARVAEYREVGAEHVAIYVTDDQPIDQFARLMAALPAAGVPTDR
jgi:alkanesulfonate monooxygenase SsuD/methylene tetrahydromethanopterin reductase-like flavin-dependent oxidoreductase (luciferase family)